MMLRRTLPLVLAVVAAASLPLSVAADGSQLEVTLDRWIQAMGGDDLLQQTNYVYMRHGAKMFGMDGSVEQWVAADGRYRADMELGGMFTVVQVFDGERGWLVDQNKKLSEIQGVDRESLITTIYDATWSHLLSGRREGTLQFIGIEEGTGSPIVQAHPMEGAAITWYLDPVSYLPAKSEQPVQERTQVTTYEAWTTVAGVRIPERLSISTGDAQYDMSFVLEEARFDKSMSASRFQKPEEKVDDTFFAEGGSARNIPIELDGVHIVMQARVNDQGPLWFILDTGASVTVLHTPTAKALGMETTGNIEGRGAGDSSVEVNLVSGVSFQVPGVEVRDQTVATIDFSHIERGFGRPIDGVLGYDFLSRFVTEIDYAASRLHLHQVDNFEYTGAGTVVPFRLIGNQPHIELTVKPRGRDPITSTFMVDTGAGSAIAFARPFSEQHQLVDTLSERFEYSGGFGVGGRTSSTVGRIESAQIGALAFDAPICKFGKNSGGATASPDEAGLIGGRLLSRCTVIFDYERGQMILEPNSNFGSPFRGDMSGLTLTTGGRGDFHHFEVVSIVDGSAAGAAGMQMGDVLTRIDGRAADDWTKRDLQALFRSQARPVEVELRRDGETVRVRLELAPLL